MKKFDEGFALFVILAVVLPIIVFASEAHENQQERAAFQQAYSKNLECRQVLKNNSQYFINNVCGPIPSIDDYVK